MDSVLTVVKRLLRPPIRWVRRHLRAPSRSSPGDVTVSDPAESDGYLWRRPGLLSVPGAFALAPKAQLSGVTPAGKPFVLHPVGACDVLQGGCTDGRFAYFILEDQKNVIGRNSERSECIIVKVDMDTWQVAARSGPLPLHHGNDMTYNPRTGQLLAVHCYDRPNDISFIDPETLTITDTREYYHSVYGIAYNPARDQYVMAIRGSYDFAVFDSRFELLRYVKGVDTRFVKQGIDCDDDYIYFATSDENAIVCYDWAGRYRGMYAVKGCDQEAENIFHRDRQWYIAYYPGGHRGGCVYRVTFDRSILAN